MNLRFQATCSYSWPKSTHFKRNDWRSAMGSMCTHSNNYILTYGKLVLEIELAQTDLNLITFFNAMKVWGLDNEVLNLIIKISFLWYSLLLLSFIFVSTFYYLLYVYSSSRIHQTTITTNFLAIKIWTKALAYHVMLILRSSTTWSSSSSHHWNKNCHKFKQVTGQCFIYAE